ncbi:MAG: hypothetical protein LBN22_03640, partial [Clostridiales Family XIII bacterium]|nr:hypothetical protein [Clostridiales Family XIII bacterium]
GVRFVEIYFTMAFGATAQMIQYINASVGIVIPIIIIETCAMSAFLYTWFRRWDGRKNLE